MGHTSAMPELSLHVHLDFLTISCLSDPLVRVISKRPAAVSLHRVTSASVVQAIHENRTNDLKESGTAAELDNVHRLLACIDAQVSPVMIELADGDGEFVTANQLSDLYAASEINKCLQTASIIE